MRVPRCLEVRDDGSMTPTTPARADLPGHWPRATDRPPLERRPGDGWLGGVCAGVATHLGLSVWAIRLVVVLTCVAWVGLPGYLFLWFTMPRVADSPPTPRLRIVVGVSALSALVLATAAGDSSGVGSHVGIPLLVAALGLVLAWSRLADRERRAWVSGDLANRESMMRTGGGAALMFAGLIMAVASGRGLDALRDIGVALVVLFGGLVAVLAPYGVRVWDSLKRSQAEAAMASARADVASHLHDSVLQTLALIQRRTTESEVAQLARTQERDLRTWLFADEDREMPATDAAEVLRRTLDAVEDSFAVPIDVVVSGSASTSPRVEVLAAALREAVTNAVRHGRPPIAVYAEISPRLIECFVRDHGDGFDVGTVLGARDDRAGVRESIVSRLERHGGSARFRRRDDGLEVILTIPLEEAS